MNMTSLLVRTLILALFAAGISVAVAGRAPRADAATPVVQTSPPRSARQVVELPTVSVRPTAAEIADAMRDDSTFEVAHAMSTSHARLTRTALPILPSLGLDMPYYSFGKALPRVSKE